jgi:hypothetical protein
VTALSIFIAHASATCAECKDDLGSGAWIHLSEDRRALCLSCVGLDELEFLPPGNAALTRRATKESTVSAVVLEWSRARKRYERQGILVEADALVRAEQACLADEDARARRAERDRERRVAIDETFVRSFGSRVRAMFPSMPEKREDAIAAHACAKGSSRVGRSAAAKSFDEEAILLAVRAHVRHKETRYDAMLASGSDVWAARQGIQPQVDAVLARWRGT